MGRRIVETEAQSVMWRVMRAKSFTVEEEQSETDDNATVSLSKEIVFFHCQNKGRPYRFSIRRDDRTLYLLIFF